MKDKKAVRCSNSKVHDSGKMLVILDKDCVYIHCGDTRCKRWTKLQISFPGVQLNFSKSAVVQNLMPEGYHFDITDASTVIGGGK